MITNETISKLQDMHLSTMARHFREQLDDPEVRVLSFEDRFGLLVDAEWTARKNNHLARLIKKAGYAMPSACVEDIEYLPERKLDKAQLKRLASCSYIQEYHNIILLGATGAGKTYLACALVWLPAGASIRSATSVCRTCSWRSPLPGARVPTGST